MARRRRRSNDSGDIAGMVIAAIILVVAWVWGKTGSMAFGIIIFFALAVLIVSVIFYFVKQAKRKLLESGIDEVDKMSGRQFEDFLKEIFIKRGFTVKDTAVVGDYGADLILENAGSRLVVQAKRWKQNVGIKAVQEAIGSIKHYKAHNGVVITNSYFTDNAIELARSNGIELWDRDKLIELLRETKKLTSSESIKDDSGMEKIDSQPAVAPAKEQLLCPRCGKSLLLRSGKRGKFWGCSAFPQCRFTKGFQGSEVS